jgi:cell division transport system permease protein
MASVVMLTITLLCITSVIFIQAILNYSLKIAESRVDVTVYFVPGAAESKVLTFKTTVEEIPEVASVKYTSEEETLSTFRERHKEDYLTLQALDELNGNPLGAELTITAKDSATYENIVKTIQSDGLAKDLTPLIDKINYNQNKLIIERLTQMIGGARVLGIGLSIILALISLIVTFTTTRLTMYYTREEIAVMRYVGANRMHIRGPFIVEGIIAGISATAITLILAGGFLWWMSPKITPFLGLDIMRYFVENLFQLFVLLGLVGMILGALSSVLAMRNYLKV